MVADPEYQAMLADIHGTTPSDLAGDVARQIRVAAGWTDVGRRHDAIDRLAESIESRLSALEAVAEAAERIQYSRTIVHGNEDTVDGIQTAGSYDMAWGDPSCHLCNLRAALARLKGGDQS
jgi:hypothetical protein